jgi:hypothetical protein
MGLKRKGKKRIESNIKRRPKGFPIGEESVLEKKIEREWKSIRCPGEKGKTLIMVEWEIVSEKGRILKRSLQQIDCHHPQFATFKGGDCEWGCERVIGKRET